MPLVDTDVLFDLVTNDLIWADWSFRQLETHGLGDRLVVNPVVYAELSVGFDQIDKVDAFLGETGVEMIEIPRAALFLPARRFRAIGPGAAPGPACCPISSLAPMPWLERWAF